MNKSLYLTHEQHLKMLKKIKTLIEEGLELQLDDSDDIGNKHTHCSWGQCTSENWDKDTLLWPGRPTPKYHAKGQFCPFDTRKQERTTKLAKSPEGCYFRCMIFQGETIPSRTEAIELYQITIKQFENDHDSR